MDSVKNNQYTISSMEADNRPVLLCPKSVHSSPLSTLLESQWTEEKWEGDI